MASPDTSPEDPRTIDFAVPELGIEAHIRIDKPSMDHLTGRQQELLILAAKTQTLILALAVEISPRVEPDKRDDPLGSELGRIIAEGNEEIKGLEEDAQCYVSEPLTTTLLGLTSFSARAKV